MKSISLVVFAGLLLGSLGLFAQLPEQDEKLLGKCEREALEEAPFQEWYQKFYASYTPNKDVLEQLKAEDLMEYQVKIFFGSWCGDSKREVPRFYRILDELKFPMEKVELIGVDKGEHYKQSPGGEEKGAGIFRVPVFILLKGGVELGRIVEYPVSTLERDILAIVKGRHYIPNYYSFPFLTQWQKEGILGDPNTDIRGLVNQIRGKVSSSSELNAAGYVFLKSNQLEEARRVFLLNVYLFPEEANTYDSLAEAFVAQGNEEGAIWAYEKVVSLQPKNEQVKERLLQLKASAKAGTSGK